MPASIGTPFISIDPPTHVQYRKIVMPALAPGRLAGIEARITERVEALLDAVPLGEPFDLVERLAAPLPILTLCELIGVEPELWEKLYHWTNAFSSQASSQKRLSG